MIGERNFHKNQMESEGTKKVIEISGPIFDTLNEGKTLIVDELDAKLHPLLTRNIVLLFMDPEKTDMEHSLSLLHMTPIYSIWRLFVVTKFGLQRRTKWSLPTSTRLWSSRMKTGRRFVMTVISSVTISGAAMVPYLSLENKVMLWDIQEKKKSQS